MTPPSSNQGYSDSLIDMNKRNKLKKGGCTSSRVYSFTEEQKLSVNNGEMPLKLTCGVCGCILHVCEFFFNSEREQWTYVDLANHLAGDGCAQHPVKRSNGKIKF